MQLEGQGVDLPSGRSQLAELTDFAVPLRYENLLDAELLDRQATVALVDEVSERARVESTFLVIRTNSMAEAVEPPP
jgi:hypothetical protein